MVEKEELKGEEKTLRIAREIFEGENKDYFTYCLEENRFYLYKMGFWQSLYEKEMIFRIGENNAKVNKQSYPRKKQIVEQLAVLTHKRLEHFNKYHLLNFPNGMFDVRGKNLLSHDPKYLSTIRLPYKYDPLIDCPLWIKTIAEIFENDSNKLNILQEFFGYCLTRETKMEKAMLLIGESRSGKSTILNTLRNLVGIENCSSVPVKKLDDETYTVHLMNKLVNMDSDVCAKASEFEAPFKTITSGEPVACSPKYVPTFEFNPFCKLVMAANAFPRITDHSSAFYKRLVLIPCERVFEENEINRDLKEQLKGELSGIFNWALEGLKRVYKRNGFEQYDFMKEAIDELREESNPIDVFFRENIVTDNITENCYIIKSELFDRYVNWCKDNGNMPMSMMRFSQAVYQKYSKFTTKKAQDHVTGKRIWRNIKFITDDTKGEVVSGWQE